MNKNVLQRFLSKVSRRSNGCWIWTAALLKRDENGRGGYGAFGIGDKVLRAHRVSYELHKGAIPTGQMVLHECDERRCVNPDHLYLGDANRNSSDMVERDREASGERSWNAKLTNRDITKVFTLRRRGWTQRAIAEEFGITQSQISRILNRHVWKKAKVPK